MSARAIALVLAVSSNMGRSEMWLTQRFASAEHQLFLVNFLILPTVTILIWKYGMLMTTHRCTNCRIMSIIIHHVSWILIWLLTFDTDTGFSRRKLCQAEKNFSLGLYKSIPSRLRLTRRSDQGHSKLLAKKQAKLFAWGFANQNSLKILLIFAQ